MSNREILNLCPLCNGDILNPYLISNKNQIVCCKSCGLLFVTPRPTEASIKRYFAEEYICTAERVEVELTEWRLASLKYEASCLKQLLSNGGKLLDLGAASGAFLGEFSGDSKWDLIGIEPSRFSAESASVRYGVTVLPGFLRDLQLQDASFDVITSLDAFFFHSDPNADLREMSRLLRPEGLLAIEIPGLEFRLLKNTGFLCKLIYGVPAKLNAGMHLFYYNRRTLSMLLAKHGFEEILSLPINMPMYGSLPVRLAKKVYFSIVSYLYRMTNGASWIPVPKEFIVYKKAKSDV